MSTPPIQIGSIVTPVSPIAATHTDGHYKGSSLTIHTGARYEVAGFEGPFVHLTSLKPDAPSVTCQLADVELW